MNARNRSIPMRAALLLSTAGIALSACSQTSGTVCNTSHIYGAPYGKCVAAAPAAEPEPEPTPVATPEPAPIAPKVVVKKGKIVM